MIVWRKPATAGWHHESAQRVDSRPVKEIPWTKNIYLHFDATKDRSGARHTSMRMILSEQDVENLYLGLIAGRKDRLEKLSDIDRRVSKCRRAIAHRRIIAKKGTPEWKFADDLFQTLFEPETK